MKGHFHDNKKRGRAAKLKDAMMGGNGLCPVEAARSYSTVLCPIMRERWRKDRGAGVGAVECGSGCEVTYREVTARLGSSASLLWLLQSSKITGQKPACQT